jgi:ribosome-associated translation inhibitor RaiA
MDINLHLSNVSLDAKARALVEEAFERAVSAHESQVKHVHVTLLDVNAQKGGIDKRCRVVVDLVRTPKPVVVEETDREIMAAVRIAAERVDQALKRTVDRRRATNRKSTKAIPAGGNPPWKKPGARKKKTGS